MRTKTALLLLASLVGALAVSCRYQPAPTFPPAVTPASATASPSPVEEAATPTATGTLLPEQATEAAAPTVTPWSTPTPLPASWKTYANADLQVTFRYPDDWQAKSATRYSGQDGFFELSTRSSAASEGTVCTLEANRNKPGRYGSRPQIVAWQKWTDGVERACLVIPSDDQPAAMRKQATALIWYPASLKPDTVLVVHANLDYLGGLLETFKFPGAGTPTPSSGVYNSPACDAPPPVAAKPAGPLGSLAVDEYSIVRVGCEPLDQFDGFQAHIPEAARGGQAQWQERFRQNLAAANQALAPFDYRLVERPTDTGILFDVYHGATTVQTGLTRLWPVSVNQSGTDFALLVQDTYHSLAPVLVRREMAITWQADSAFFYFPIPPVFTGDELTWVEFERNDPWPPTSIKVKRGNQTIYTITTMPPSPGGGPVRSLWAWDGHWVLDLEGVVVMDGEILNDKRGYDEMFQWQLLGGKPFYIFRQGKQMGLSHDGQTLLYRYDDVIHGFLCCDPAVYNIQSSSIGVWFYAQRDGVWYYVAITGEP